jgi:hypothetical protein
MLRVTVYDAFGEAVDATPDVSGAYRKRVAGECAEFGCTVTDRTGDTYRNVLSAERLIEATWRGVRIFTGYLERPSVSHGADGDTYDITAYSADIVLGEGDTGTRSFLEKYGHEILQGWAGDRLLSADIATAGTLDIASDNASDTPRINILGKSGPFIIGERLRLAGTTPVATANEYDTLLYAELESAAEGTVTISDAGTSTVGSLSAGETSLYRTDAQGNHSNGIMYGRGFALSFSRPMAHRISSFPVINEPPVVTMARIEEMGDTDPSTDEATEWTHALDSETDTITLMPKAATGTLWQKWGDVTVDYEGMTPAYNAVILKGAKVADTSGVPREVVGYASATGGRTRIYRAQDTSVKAAADAAQKAEALLSELSQEDRWGDAVVPLETGIALYDAVKVFDPSSYSWAEETVFEAEDDFDALTTTLRVGHRIPRFASVTTLTGLENVAIYGSVGVDSALRPKSDTHTFAGNISPDRDLEIRFDVPDEGISGAWLHVRGMKYVQNSAGDHDHDAGSSYTFDPHDHGDGTLAGDSHSHDDGSYAASSHSHGDGTYSAASHDHSISLNTVAGVPNAAHRHSISHGHGDSFSVSSMTGSTQSGGSHYHGIDGYQTTTDGSHSHSMPHTHSLLGAVSDHSGDSGLPTSTTQYYVGGVAQTATGNTAAGVSGESDSEGAGVGGNSGTTGVAVGGSTGSRGGSVSGSSGGNSAQPGLKEVDAYPDTLNITINGIDRTAALGGPWGDGSTAFELALDITDYVQADGSYTVAFSSADDGRLEGYARINY